MNARACPSPPTLPCLVAEFPKNNSESFRITLAEFKGTNVIDVRVWLTRADDTRPTKSGLSTSVKHLRALAHALNKAVEQAEELGLIDG